MCGFVTLWDRRAATSDDDLRSACVRMRDTLVHRGPDSAGVWTDAAAGIALGHRRLSIIDLSPAGHQPMASPSGRWQVAYNGEIYNFEALRAELPAQAWRGHSDTEVLCAALDHWGLPATLERLRGMFAISAWDRDERALWLVRDRLGQKPLYWFAGPRHVLAGSELRALRVHAACPMEIDRDALAGVLRSFAVPQPRTVLQGVRQVEPGCWVRVAADGSVHQGRYWSATDAARDGVAPSSLDEAIERVETVLTESVTLRAIADVPVGTLLSGGIDSTLITALLLKAGVNVRTYTVGVDDPEHDEAPAAAAIARHFGTEHTTLQLRETDLQHMVPDLVRLQDEPFADASLLPTALVCRLAREHVTVALGGDGGDELFGGYSRYARAMQAWSMVERVPSSARSLVRRGILPLHRSNAQGRLALPPAVQRLVRRGLQGSARDLAEVYRTVTSALLDPDLYVQGTTPLETATLPDVPGDPVRRLMLQDLLCYLPDDILVKTDRASMATSLELRAPLLDHKVAELALSLPATWTFHGGEGKHLLKELLARHVPRTLWERPKQGFGVPMDAWLRGPLRPWAEDLLSEQALQRTGLWHVNTVRQRWREHLAGANHRQILWGTLQVQAWLGADPNDAPRGAIR